MNPQNRTIYLVEYRWGSEIQKGMGYVTGRKSACENR